MALPSARKTDLLVEELPGGEVLVYDLLDHRAHSLNPAAALVWRQCDGQTSHRAAAGRLHAQLGLPADEEIVQLALNRLSRAGLVAGEVPGASDASRVRRRDLVRRLALTGGMTLLLPVVMSIVAPTAAEAASCAHTAQACNASKPCCRGCLCSAGLVCVGVC